MIGRLLARKTNNITLRFNLVFLLVPSYILCGIIPVHYRHLNIHKYQFYLLWALHVLIHSLLSIWCSYNLKIEHHGDLNLLNYAYSDLLQKLWVINYHKFGFHTDHLLCGIVLRVIASHVMLIYVDLREGGATRGWRLVGGTPQLALRFLEEKRGCHLVGAWTMSTIL